MSCYKKERKKKKKKKKRLTSWRSVAVGSANVASKMCLAPAFAAAANADFVYAAAFHLPSSSRQTRWCCLGGIYFYLVAVVCSLPFSYLLQ